MPKKKCKAKSSSRVAATPLCTATSENVEIKIGTGTRPGGQREVSLYTLFDLKPLPIQEEGVDFVFKEGHEKFAKYLAYDPGLGKTIMAAMILNRLNLRAPTKAYYVCPPFLASNTDAEFEKWAFHKNLYLLPDSKIGRGMKLNRGRIVRESETVENLKNDLEMWPGETVLFVDEAHRFKNEKTGRTKALLKLILPLFDRVVYMSGTPLPNGRPKELWPILYHSAPKIFGHNFFPFALKYCGAFETDFGWNFDGFTNKTEFKARLHRTFMKRVRKNVLGLPPKIEGLLTVGDGMPATLQRVEKELLRHYSKEDIVEGKIAKMEGVAALHLATYLRLLGEYKVKYVMPFIEAFLEETDRKILIFAMHKETIEKLRFNLAEYNPFVIRGGVPKKKRTEMVKRFQEDKDQRVGILQIQAGGIGYTLTKATLVLLVEFSWVDGENTQASDRAHRIGQTETVDVRYVVLKGSIDGKRMGVLLKKRQNEI